MYFRFVSTEVDPSSRTETGPFRMAWRVFEDPTVPHWLIQAIDQEYTWFDDHLPTPALTRRRIGRRGLVFGVCWFRPDAQECIARARHMAWLLTEAGWPVQERCSRHPGEILFKDDWQVVADPRHLKRR